MSTPLRLTAFAAGLAVIGSSAAAVGSATKLTPPVGGAIAAHGHGGSVHDMQMGSSRMPMGGSGATAHGMAMPGMAPMVAGADGTRLSLSGVTLAPASDRLTAGRASTWRFGILDQAGMPVRRFDRDQTKLLHLIVARLDLTGYQHLHPVVAADGTFSVALTLDKPGRYRAITDLTTGGKRYVLGTTLTAPGAAPAKPLPAQASTASTDGYAVSLSRPVSLMAGREAEMTFRVSHNGQPVTGLQPYLGAYGHLVALHAGDLAYSHVHPSGRDRERAAITFHTELPTSGFYRLFLQFRTGGRVHTVAFTQLASK
ncbi:MAG: hypothetical protein ACR2OB_12380 [Solirubrobacteraceae bacterium]